MCLIIMVHPKRRCLTKIWWIKGWRHRLGYLIFIFYFCPSANLKMISKHCCSTSGHEYFQNKCPSYKHTCAAWGLLVIGRSHPYNAALVTLAHAFGIAKIRPPNHQAAPGEDACTAHNTCVMSTLRTMEHLSPSPSTMGHLKNPKSWVNQNPSTKLPFQYCLVMNMPRLSRQDPGASTEGRLLLSTPWWGVQSYWNTDRTTGPHLDPLLGYQAPHPHRPQARWTLLSLAGGTTSANGFSASHSLLLCPFFSWAYPLFRER